MAKIYGYARCSLSEEKGQDLNRQTRELKAAGAEEIITEREHGDREKPNLEFLLEHMEPKSTLIVCEASRLSRSVKELCEIIELIQEKRFRLMILGSITIDCREGVIDPMSQAFIQMSGVFNQLELSLLRARVRSGLANAKAKGRKLGRPKVSKKDLPAVFLKYYPQLMNGGMNVTELAKVCGLSRPTVYKYISMME